MNEMKNITVKLTPEQGQEYVIELPKFLEISKETIDADIVKHSATYAWLGVIAAKLKGRRDRAEAALSEIRSFVDLETRTAAENSGLKITEGRIAAAVESNPKCMLLRKELIDIDEQLSTATAIKDAFYHRKDMLVTLGANMRTEMEAEFYLKKGEHSGR